MPYNGRKSLGQDDFDWPSELYQLPSESVPVYEEQPADMVIYSSPSTPWGATPAQETDSWSFKGIWESISGALVPVSQAAANIIRATQGQPSTTPTTIPPGYTRTATGQLVPVGQVSGFNVQSLILPAALGLGAFMLLSSGKKRRR